MTTTNQPLATPFAPRRSTTPPVVTVAMLWKAAKQHDANKVKELLLQYSHSTSSLVIVNEFHPKTNTNTLMIACKKRDKSHKHHNRSAADTVQVLIEFGAEVDAKSTDKDQNTALHFAAMSNQVRSVEFLLHSGADAFALNHHGLSPLDVARFSESRGVIDLLTQNARIHCGYVYYKKLADSLAAIQVRRWKKLYAVALACDNDRSVIELSLFKLQEHPKPYRVILLRRGTHEFVAREKAGWQDKHNMFHANRPLFVQKMSSKHHYSRTIGWQIHHEETGRSTERMRFATDNIDQRDQWLSVLNGTFGGTAAQAPPRPSVVAPRSSTPTSYSYYQPPQHENVLWAETNLHVASAPSFSSVDGVPDLMARSATQRESSSSSDEDTDGANGGRRGECLICMDAKKDAICVPCGHVAGCHRCLVRHVVGVKKCPICRANVQSVIKIYDC